MARFSRKPWQEPGFNSYSREAYKKLRLGYWNKKGEFVPPKFIQGVEWNYLNSRVCIYNLDLVESYFTNFSSPEEHLKNVQAYLSKK